LQQGENKIYNEVKQWEYFGAGGNSFRRSLIDKVRFNTAFEFGYGEDADFLVRNFVIWKVRMYVFQSLIFFAFKKLMVVSESNQFSLHGDFYSAQTITNSHVVSIVHANQRTAKEL
jgi:hypothetical protein